MNKTIEFARHTYEMLMKAAATGTWESNNDFLGRIEQGAVCCDLTIIEDKGFESEDFCFGGKYVINAYYFLLGKDTGYGETPNGTPYDCVSGFYGYLKDTYEETVDGLVRQFDECMDGNSELIAGTKEETLTWENDRSNRAVERGQDG